jgi:hypothetical protein
MQVLKCNIFNECKSGDALCITTNAVVNKEGKLIMGAGIAKDFRDNFKDVDKVLGNYVTKYGNRVFRVGEVEVKVGSEPGKTVTIFSFPTKSNWRDKSDLKLIEQSCIQLKQVVEKFKIEGDIYVPAPGCSNGGLDWTQEVKPVVERHLVEDRYKICFKDDSVKVNKYNIETENKSGIEQLNLLTTVNE